MADEIRCYLDARKHYDTAARHRSELIALIQEVSGYLSNDPMKFIFSNVAQGLPPEASMSRTSKSADGNRWPNADKIQASLAKLHEAKRALLSAWDALPHDDRSAMVPPPDRFVPTRRIENR